MGSRLKRELSMLRDLSWQTTDTLIRAQLAMFHALGDQIGLTRDDRRRVLRMDDPTWAAWAELLSDGPLPAEPPLPEMLRRLGTAAIHLSIEAERFSTRR
jgi:hypothetical protein